MLLSIAICTYNRATYLKRALQSITEISSSHRVPIDDWEILVIDNNSNDETKAVVTEFESKLPIRYLLEKQQGLSFARNRALNSFLGDWIVFTDDDMTFSPVWLDTYYQRMKSDHDDFLSGPIMPKFINGQPSWLSFPPFGNLAGLLGYYDLGDSNLSYKNHTSTPFGANFALSREAIKKYGEFNTDLGRKGNDRGRGEETDYFASVLSQGGQGCYLAQALNYHWVDDQVFSLTYLWRHGYAKGIESQYQALNCVDGQANDVKPIFYQMLFQLMKKLMYQVIGFCKQFITGKKDRAYQCIIMVGLFCAQLKMLWTKK